MGIDLAWFHRSYFNFYALVNEAVSPSDFTPDRVTAPTDARLPGDINGPQVCGVYDVVPSKFGTVVTRAYDYDKYSGGSQTYNGFDFQATARLKRGAFLQGGIGTATWHSISATATSPDR